MKKLLLIGVIAAVAIAIAIAVAMNSGRASTPVAKDATIPSETMKTYVSEKYGITFQYPSYYFLEERDIDLTRRVHHEIILTEDTEENRAIREGRMVGGEGPVAITIDIFQNNLDKQTAEQFIINTSESNYKLGNGDLASTTKGSVSGMIYDWSGLYEGRSFVVSKPAYVYMFSVTRLNPEDRIVADFEGVLQTATIVQ